MNLNTQNKSRLYLHIGCGQVLLPGFVNMDIRDTDGIDKVSLAYPVDYDNDTFDLIYACHILEHFPRKQTLNVLQEWIRLLKKDGILRISVPNIDALIKIYQDTKELDQIIGPLYGGQDYRFNFHYTIFDYITVKNLMEKAGLTAIHHWDFKRTIHSDYWDFSQAETKGILISLNIEGRKKNPMEE